MISRSTLIPGFSASNCLTNSLTVSTWKFQAMNLIVVCAEAAIGISQPAAAISAQVPKRDARRRVLRGLMLWPFIVGSLDRGWRADRHRWRALPARSSLFAKKILA